MKTLAFWIIALHIAALSLLAQPAHAQVPPFEFVSESAIYNPATGDVQFTVEFNQPPDFWTADFIGRQNHAFQFFIDGDPNLPYPTNYDAIIGGAEIYDSIDRIRIRKPNSTDPLAGWGPVRASVPFSLDGNSLRFSAPLEVLTDKSDGGLFSYELEVYEDGGLTNYVFSESIVLPPPLEADIDVRPGSKSNRINPRSEGNVPVAILTTNGFDARDVDPEAVRFGATGAEAEPGRYSFRDVDRDRDIDMVLRFEIEDTGIRCRMTSARLTGETTDGRLFSGSDSIRTTGCRWSHHDDDD